MARLSHRPPWEQQLPVHSSTSETSNRSWVDMIDPMSNASNPMNPKDELATAVSELYLDEQKANVEQEARRHLNFWRTMLNDTPTNGVIRFVRPASIDPVRPELVYVALRVDVDRPHQSGTFWYLTGNFSNGLTTVQFIELLVSWRIESVEFAQSHWLTRVMPARAAIEATSDAGPNERALIESRRAARRYGG